MPIGCHRAQSLPVGLEQSAVEVIAHILLRHCEMRLVDEAPAIGGAHRQGVLRVDFIDDTGAFFDAKPYLVGALRDRTPLMHEIRKDGLDL